MVGIPWRWFLTNTLRFSMAMILLPECALPIFGLNADPVTGHWRFG
jgi:hypothetical protein